MVQDVGIKLLEGALDKVKDEIIKRNVRGREQQAGGSKLRRERWRSR